MAVLLFHLGGLGYVTGRAAVAGFFMLSGYVIARALDCGYALDSSGWQRFYVNRFLRIVPLFMILSVATWLFQPLYGHLLVVDGEPSYDIAPKAGATGGYLGTTDGWFPRIFAERGVVVVTFDFSYVPQGWSIGLQVVFYLLAPLLLGLYRRHWVAGAAVTLPSFGYLVYAIACNATFADYDQPVYWNALTNFWLFALGMTLQVGARPGQAPWPAVLRATCSSRSTTGSCRRRRGSRTHLWGG